MDPSITIWHAGSKGPSMKDDLTMESGHREGSMKQRPLRIPFKKYDVHSAAKGEGVTICVSCLIWSSITYRYGHNFERPF